ncbi:MAG: class I SAM-dependent methyltransferase family protein [Akkermansiaceae bacterium]|nr:class I SAM-dependent methyltransferase family protein [Verrucomicrobiales bacterium]
MSANNGKTGIEAKDAVVTGQTSDGVEIHARLLKLTRFSASLEIFDPNIAPSASAVIEKFQVLLQNRAVYSGRAVVRNMVNAGSTMICEVALSENFWIDLEMVAGGITKDQVQGEFDQFIQNWQKSYRVGQDYKIVIADIQSFLDGLRLWLDRVELGIRSALPADQSQLETDIASRLSGPVSSAMGSMFERFELVAERIDKESIPEHRSFGQRQLHPYLLCAPFIHRTYAKPLGYAGDYEMMNMIVRNGLEGNSLYAKLVNAYLLDQAPARAVRNRVGFLEARIAEETSRISRSGGTASIFCIACGPAWEVTNFLNGHPLANHARFDLLDFNDETLRHTTAKIAEIKKKNNLRTQVNLVKNSVQNLLKANSKQSQGAPQYDLIYCSGLYDYLNDRICKALNNYLYSRLLPGGIMVVGNFAPSTPIRNMMEHALEWFLIYRDGKQLAVLSPDDAPPENCRIIAEPTGTNIFLEVRKPK